MEGGTLLVSAAVWSQEPARGVRAAKGLGSLAQLGGGGERGCLRLRLFSEIPAVEDAQDPRG